MPDMSTMLVACPVCKLRNFSVVGLKAHRCRADGRRRLTREEVALAVDQARGAAAPTLDPEAVAARLLWGVRLTQAEVSALPQGVQDRLRFAWGGDNMATARQRGDG